jgi:hypothetical protein
VVRDGWSAHDLDRVEAYPLAGFAHDISRGMIRFTEKDRSSGGRDAGSSHFRSSIAPGMVELPSLPLPPEDPA